MKTVGPQDMFLLEQYLEFPARSFILRYEQGPFRIGTVICRKKSLKISHPVAHHFSVGTLMCSYMYMPSFPRGQRVIPRSVSSQKNWGRGGTSALFSPMCHNPDLNWVHAHLGIQFPVGTFNRGLPDLGCLLIISKISFLELLIFFRCLPLALKDEIWVDILKTALPRKSSSLPLLFNHAGNLSKYFFYPIIYRTHVVRAYALKLLNNYQASWWDLRSS